MRGRMSQDQFLLKWNNHQNNFVEVFNFLRTQDAFVDVTLACDGKSFSAHKVVLSACSPYFQTLFQTNPCKHPIVFLKDVKGQDMEALIEFIYKGEVSVSQTELGSLISTAENLKIKGLAEPERPLEKTVKRLASPPRVQGGALPLQHAPLTLFQQSSPNAKRKRSDPYGSHCAYTNSRGSDKEEKMAPNSLSSDNGPSQVVLLPPHDSGGTIAPTDLTPQQGYVSHHPSLTSSEGGVLYSVAGSAIYVGSSQGGGNARGDIVREVYPPPAEPYNNGNGNEDTIPGPSGVQTPHQNESSSMSIKLEPTVPVPTEGWDGSNQSYEDGGAGSDGGGGGVSTPSGGIGSSSDPISLSLPLHSELTEPPLQDSSARGLMGGVSTWGAGRPHPCLFCNKVFPFKSILRNHLRIHTGEKPYTCRVCGRFFNHCSNYYKHERTCVARLSKGASGSQQHLPSQNSSLCNSFLLSGASTNYSQQMGQGPTNNMTGSALLNATPTSSAFFNNNSNNQISSLSNGNSINVNKFNNLPSFNSSLTQCLAQNKFD